VDDMNKSMLDHIESKGNTSEETETMLLGNDIHKKADLSL
jgi:hypothetical protein